MFEVSGVLVWEKWRRSRSGAEHGLLDTPLGLVLLVISALFMANHGVTICLSRTAVQESRDIRTKTDLPPCLRGDTEIPSGGAVSVIYKMRKGTLSGSDSDFNDLPDTTSSDAGGVYGIFLFDKQTNVLRGLRWRSSKPGSVGKNIELGLEGDRYGHKADDLFNSLCIPDNSFEWIAEGQSVKVAYQPDRGKAELILIHLSDPTKLLPLRAWSTVAGVCELVAIFGLRAGGSVYPDDIAGDEDLDSALRLKA
ncbi:hypothetical protein V8E36_002237 [Tilletia maclaganii]